MTASARPPVARALAEAVRGLRPRRAVRRPATFLLEAAAFAVAYAGYAAPAARSADLAEAGGLLATAFLVSLVEALSEAGARERAAAWREAVRGLRTVQAFGDGSEEPADAEHLRAGDRVVVKAGEIIPADGVVLEGAATVDESALTGESAPVVREAAAPRDRVIGGSRVLSDRLKIQVDGAPGAGLLRRLADRIDASLGRAAGRETGLALAALLLGAVLLARGLLASGGRPATPSDYAPLVAFAALLLPASLAALAGAAGSLGVRRLLRRGLLARDARAVDAAARAQTLVLEEAAGTTSRRRAVEFVPAGGISAETLANAAQLTTLIDETPEGRSIVVLAKSMGLRGRRLAEMKGFRFVPLSPHTRVSGFDSGELVYRKGPAEAVAGLCGGFSAELASALDRIRRTGGEAVAIADGTRVLGLVHMREPESAGLRERLVRLRAAGVRSVLGVRAASPAAQALAVELGVDELAVAAAPAARTALVEREKAAGRRTAASGDVSADSGVLAAADAAVARGARASPEADPAVWDLREDPAQLAEAVAAARAARRARNALDGAALIFDCAKGAAAAVFLFLALSAGMGFWELKTGAPVIDLALVMTALGLAPLLLLAAAAFAGFL